MNYKELWIETTENILSNKSIKNYSENFKDYLRIGMKEFIDDVYQKGGPSQNMIKLYEENIDNFYKQVDYVFDIYNNDRIFPKRCPKCKGRKLEHHRWKEYTCKKCDWKFVYPDLCINCMSVNRKNLKQFKHIKEIDKWICKDCGSIQPKGMEYDKFIEMVVNVLIKNKDVVQ